MAAARKLIASDGVLAITGSYGTAPSASTFPYVIDQEKVPFLMSNGGAEEWYVPPKPGLFGAQVLFEDQGNVLGRWAAKEGAKSIVVVHTALTAYE